MADKDLTLDFTNKKIINSFIKGKNLTIQQVVLSLQCWVGDWFLDGEFGTAYDLRLNNKSLLLSDIQSVILSNDKVSSVKDLDMYITYDGINKSMKVVNISATIFTTDGEEIVFNELVPIVGV